MIVPIALSIAGRDLEIAFEIEPGNKPDDAIMFYLEHNQVCEPEVCQLLARVLNEGDVAVDAGANVGYFTLIMSRFVGDTGRVIAIEPGPNNLEKLNRNLLLNNCQNVTVIDRPLWCADVDVPFYLYDDGGMNSMWKMREEDEAMGMVKATTLDKVCEHVAPKLLKMDVEGGEVDAIAGGAKILSGKRPVIVTEVNPEALKRAGGTPYKLRRALEAYGYRPFVLHSDGSLPSQIPSNTRIEPKRQNANVLFTTALDVGKAWPEIVL